MGRVRTNLQIGDREFWTLFDTGSRNSYVLPKVARGLPVGRLQTPWRVSLGGEKHELFRVCYILGRIGKYPVHIDAYVIDDLGIDEGGRPIEILFGALAMQKWGIRPLPDEERLDFTHYTKEFMELAAL
jgi:hypothetical protein